MKARYKDLTWISFAFVATLLIEGGCAHRRPSTILNAHNVSARRIASARQEAMTDELDSDESDLESSIGIVDSDMDPESRTSSIIPSTLNTRVVKWIKFFQGRGRKRFEAALARGERYRPWIEKQLEKEKLPSELYYLPLIESSFVTYAASPASAVGVWQFIRATGKRYGLRADSYVDERRDPLRSTFAAISYLKDLKNIFNSWYLSLAAYNAGEGRIMRAIMKGESRDFWELMRNGSLPRETQDYIPKFIAAAIIGDDPESYGFRDPVKTGMPELERVRVPSRLPVRAIASRIFLKPSTLQAYNPQLLRGITPPGSAYEIWVPSHLARRVAALDWSASRTIASLPRKARSHRAVAKRGRATSRRVRHVASARKHRAHSRMTARSRIRSYRVRKGDNLTILSRRFNVPVHKIKRANRLRRDRLYAGQSLRIPNWSGGGS